MASLEVLKKQIEILNENRQSDILELFIKHNVVVTENNNGSFINLTLVKAECLDEIKKYLSYVVIQEKDLMKDEMEKDKYKSDYFTDKEL
jgi:hypothetical protein